MGKTKNLTVTMTEEEHEDLEYLVNYFQEQSISTVTKSDVVKFMLRQMKRQVENSVVKEVNKLIEKADESNE